MKIDWLAQAKEIEKQIVSNRKYLHSHAETGFDLPKTREFAMTQLKEMGYEPKIIGKGAIVADLVGNKDRKMILLRADMDALPYPDGPKHGCGHDLHAAMLLGAAQLLMDNRSTISGRIRLLFQPAEEILEGAKDAIANGVLDNPTPDAAVMIHVLSIEQIPAGTVIVSSPGISAPAADYFEIQVQGKGCHGSTPQQGVDALCVAARIVLGLQNLPAREVSSGEGSVLTVGMMHAGSAGNVIADSATVCGTIRCFDEDTRKFMKNRLKEISRGIAGAFQAKATVKFTSGCPTLTNDENISAKAFDALKQLHGCNVIRSDSFGTQRGGGSEDFAYISHRVPSVMLALSAGVKKDGQIYPLHHPKVTFDDSVLHLGAAILAQVAASILNA